MTAISQSNRNLDQRRAKHAWEAVANAKHAKGYHEGQDSKKFGGQAKKLPMRIMAAGLGQALAFLQAKKYAPGLLIELADWILDKRSAPDSKQPKPAEDALLHRIIDDNSEFLRRATDEALAYLQWLNRFAEVEGLTDDTGD